MAIVRLFIFSLFLFSGYNCAFGQLQDIGTLPIAMKEISGIIQDGKGQYIAINDSGNPNELYVLSENGKLLRKVEVKNAKNKDWEAITSDRNGNLFIADLGNNGNKREKLVIYKVNEADVYQNSYVYAMPIEIKYADQKKFPPKEKHLNYDVEALIHHNHKLYSFTKNRTRPFTGYTYVYEIEIQSDKQKVKRVDSLFLGSDKVNNRVTDAAISRDQRHLVLLSHDRIWMISDFALGKFSSGYIQEIALGHISQKESLCFNSDSTLAICDERTSLLGGKLYEFNLSKNIAHIDSIRKHEVFIPNPKFEDTLNIHLDLNIAGEVYFEIFNHNMKRVDFQKIGLFEKGQHTVSISPKGMINAEYMLNIIVGNRPHGFFVKRFKEIDWDELYNPTDTVD
jgi:hypothetical protein